MSSLNEIIKRHYTKELEADKSKEVFDLFQWKKVDVVLKDYKTGKVLTDLRDLEFPDFYSQNACDIIASKYFRRAGVNNELGYENSMRMVTNRLVSFWLGALKDEGLITTEEQASVFYDEMIYILLDQQMAPNSPQWFNTGLNLIYGIKGKKAGHYYYDESKGKVVESDDFYTRTQASACFILSIEDKLLGPHSISEHYVTETRLFKGGSGTGTNFSAIRGKGEPLSGGGVSSGLMSFLKGLDRNAGAIKSGGTTRRAAKMLCLDVDHPEIMDFITWKAKEEDKVRALGKMGYDMSFEGEAYETVSGQNGNNSVRFNDEFMKKVKNLDDDPDATITLRGRKSKEIDREISVKEIWEAFNVSMWKSADPAPQFDETFNAWHTCPAGEDGNYNAKHNRINSTNPCGEYAFLDDTSCNLASINVFKFYDDVNKKFDLEAFMHVVGITQLVLEASVRWGQFPTEDIARKTYMFRTTGLGMANLASLIMAFGFPYDSKEARALAASLSGILTGHSYYTSAIMSEHIGPFEKYEINKEYMLRVIRNHARVAGYLNTPYEDLGYAPAEINHKVLKKKNFAYLSDAVKQSWQNALLHGEKYGYRNAQVSVMAPTGTISLAMDCGATSVEPFFSHFVYKKLSGGGFMTIANPVLELSLLNLGYSDKETEEIIAYIMRKETVNEDGYEYEKIVDGKIEGAPHLKKEHLPIFDTANQCGTGKRYIAPMGHVKMVAAITPLISGAISKTVNLPRSATVDDFKEVILASWKMGVKGITLYRDGCKASQPLNTSLSDEYLSDPEDLSYAQLVEKVKELSAGQGFSKREKMVGIRSGRTHPAQIDDVKIYTTVNRNPEGKISEIYITTDREGTIITGLLNSLSKSISVMLQYQVPPQNIARMLRGQKYEPYGFVQRHPNIKYVTSISDLISKIIDIEMGDYSRCQVKEEGFRPLFMQSAAQPSTTGIVLNDDYEDCDEDEDNDNDNDNDFSLMDGVDDTDTESAKYGVADRDNPGLFSYANINKSGSHAGIVHTEGERLYDSVCPTCSSTRMIKNGTCKVCLDCGGTTGCS